MLVGIHTRDNSVIQRRRNGFRRSAAATAQKPDRRDDNILHAEIVPFIS